LGKPRKIDARVENVAHGIAAARVEVVGREHARGKIKREELAALRDEREGALETEI